MSLKETVIVVDANHFLHRYYHTIKDNVEKIVSLYRFRLLNFMQFHKPKSIHICFDEGGSDYRRQLLPTYKSNRPPMSDDMRVIKHKLIRESLQITNKVYISRGIEADDIIASLCKRLKTEYDVIILTCDKDLNQLIDDSVRIIHPFKLTESTKNNLRFTMGVDPHQVVDYLSMVGDTVDYINGIPDIGKSRAIRLLTQYDTLDGLLSMENSNEPYLPMLLRFKSRLDINRKLITLLDDLPVGNYLIQNN